MSFLKLATSRLIQFFGNALKAIFFLFHIFFPNKRFIIPRYSKPLISIASVSRIPRIIWQTNYTSSVTLPVYINYLWNRLMAPTYDHYYWVDQDRIDFISSVYGSDVLNVFMRLKIGAAQADYWRILVLLKHGGVYLDVDAAFCWPIAFTLGKSLEELFICPTGKPVTNYFIASKPGHPIIDKISRQIKVNIERQDSNSIYDLTGPVVVERIITDTQCEVRPANLVCKQGIFVQKKYQYPDKTQVHWIEEEKKGGIYND